VATDIEDVWLVNITDDPLTIKLPVIDTLPVNWWVFDSWLPNCVDPVT
jgi:hypothetical protein